MQKRIPRKKSFSAKKAPAEFKAKPDVAETVEKIKKLSQDGPVATNLAKALEIVKERWITGALSQRYNDKVFHCALGALDEVTNCGATENEDARRFDYKEYDYLHDALPPNKRAEESLYKGDRQRAIFRFNDLAGDQGRVINLFAKALEKARKDGV